MIINEIFENIKIRFCLLVINIILLKVDYKYILILWNKKLKNICKIIKLGIFNFNLILIKNKNNIMTI